MLSEVARLIHQIDAEYEAAHRALYGLASGVSQHEFITARVERMAQYVEELHQLAGEEVVRQVLTQQGGQHA